MEAATTGTDMVARLTAAYRAVAEGPMKDLPICNDALEVEAVGFRPHESGWLGVMITPWFMNLTVLPGDDDAREVLAGNYLGEEIGKNFPAGKIEFAVAELAGIGRLLTSSLFSPVFMFEEQEVARRTAESVLEALFEKPWEDPSGSKTASRRDLLCGRIGSGREGRL